MHLQLQIVENSVILVLAIRLHARRYHAKGSIVVSRLFPIDGRGSRMEKHMTEDMNEATSGRIAADKKRQLKIGRCRDEKPDIQERLHVVVVNIAYQ